LSSSNNNNNNNNNILIILPIIVLIHNMSLYRNTSRSASSIISLIVIYAIASFSLSTVQAQTVTNQTAGQPSVNDILSEICASNSSGNSGNITRTANSTTQAVVEIRCLLEEASKAIAGEAVNETLQIIDAAENKVLATFGGNNTSSSAVGNVNINNSSKE
jgi:hypothetical protein